MNGSRPNDNVFFYDGAVATRTRSNGTSIGAADVDATQEVQILTANYNAEYGRSGGGQVRVVTKSGSRDFHAHVFEYFRNSAMDANTWAPFLPTPSKTACRNHSGTTSSAMASMGRSTSRVNSIGIATGFSSCSARNGCAIALCRPTLPPCPLS